MTRAVGKYLVYTEEARGDAGRGGSTWYIPRRPVVTQAMGEVPGIIISLKYLVYIEEACSDAGHGEILL